MYVMRTTSGSLDWIEAVLLRMRDRTVTVFGDFCVDAYWALEQGAPEVSIETGLPVKRVLAQRYSLGGAGNVVANLAALGVGSVRAVGVAGADIFGQKLRELLTVCGAATDGLLQVADWQTMVYAKPCFGDQEDSRIDFGAFNKTPNGLIDALLAELEKAIVHSSAVILNQQVPGGLSSPQTIARINEMVARYPAVTFLVDARHYPEYYKGAALKLNMAEAARLLGETADRAATESAAETLALRLHRRIGKPAFLTRGEYGLAVAVDGEVTVIPGIQVIERTDTVGAGDTVVAALAASLAAGASPLQAATLANLAAVITVKKLQTTGTASPEEILAAAEEPNYVFRPELADAPRLASYLPGTEIEIVGTLPADLEIKHCIFDHDGTISTLREGWEQIMEPMMLKAILGDRYEAADEAAYAHVRELVRHFIDRTTGIQTLAQMKGLADLVRQCGFVPETEILDQHGYKQIFNDALLAMIAGRVEKLRRGELQPADFEIKNAHLLLETLHRKGVKLYLASGTDHADVLAEAEAMGYAHLFEGRIFGSVGDLKVEAKKVVLERIIRENDLAGHEFATFGDGPVEIRETERRGGFCVGVASDEVRRFGLNLSKRKRLIRAGAKVVIPDYSQLDALLKLLRLE
jgi:rfaE bifunctional protein kinase chain/domain